MSVFTGDERDDLESGIRLGRLATVSWGLSDQRWDSARSVP